MQSVVGIFSSCAAADKAVREMLQQGIPPQSLIFLTSEQLPQQQVEQVPPPILKRTAWERLLAHSLAEWWARAPDLDLAARWPVWLCQE